MGLLYGPDLEASRNATAEEEEEEDYGDYGEGDLFGDLEGEAEYNMSGVFDREREFPDR